MAAAIFVLALAVRLLHVWQIRSAPFFSVLMGDSRGYDEWAQRIAGGDWFGHEVFYQAPLYPYLLGVIYTVGAAIAPNVPSLIGGNAVSYSVSPALPAGPDCCASGSISRSAAAASSWPRRTRTSIRASTRTSSMSSPTSCACAMLYGECWS